MNPKHARVRATFYFNGETPWAELTLMDERRRLVDRVSGPCTSVGVLQIHAALLNVLVRPVPEQAAAEQPAARAPAELEQPELEQPERSPEELAAMRSRMAERFDGLPQTEAIVGTPAPETMPAPAVELSPAELAQARADNLSRFHLAEPEGAPETKPDP